MVSLLSLLKESYRTYHVRIRVRVRDRVRIYVNVRVRVRVKCTQGMLLMSLTPRLFSTASMGTTPSMVERPIMMHCHLWSRERNGGIRGRGRVGEVVW